MRPLTPVRRILIVDDNADSADLLALVLGREGHDTRVAYDPHEAIPLAREFRPQIAFLDIGLPGMDGFQLLQILRSMPDLPACRFIAVTGYEADIERASDAGRFDDHLIKPIDLNAVARLVSELASPEPADAKPASA